MKYRPRWCKGGCCRDLNEMHEDEEASYGVCVDCAEEHHAREEAARELDHARALTLVARDTCRCGSGETHGQCPCGAM